MIDHSEGLTLGVKFHLTSTPMLAQAVGAVVIQSLYSVFHDFGATPDVYHPSFNHSVAATGPSGPEYAAGIHLAAIGNQTGDYVLTSGHIATTLALLGFDFSNQESLTNLVEYNFDVVISKWKFPEVVIARGYLKNKIVSGGS